MHGGGGVMSKIRQQKHKNGAVLFELSFFEGFYKSLLEAWK